MSEISGKYSKPFSTANSNLALVTVYAHFFKIKLIKRWILVQSLGPIEIAT